MKFRLLLGRVDKTRPMPMSSIFPHLESVLFSYRCCFSHQTYSAAYADQKECLPFVYRLDLLVRLNLDLQYKRRVKLTYGSRVIVPGDTYEFLMQNGVVLLKTLLVLGWFFHSEKSLS